MKRFVWILIGILVGAVACGTDDTASSAQEQDAINTYIVTSNDPGELSDEEFDAVVINFEGRDLPCIIWKDRRESAEYSYAYSGLTCDFRPR